MSDLKWTTDDKTAAYVKLLTQKTAEQFLAEMTSKCASKGMFEVKIVGD